MAKIDLISRDWTEMVFEGRNKEYGAYRLRKNAGKRNLYSLITIFIAALAIWGGISLVKFVESRTKSVAQTSVAELSALNQPKKKAEVKQQKKVKLEQPEKVVERVKSSVKFTAPVIKKDDEVKPEDELKTQDELMSTKTAIGALDVKGNDDANGEVLKIKEAVAQPEPKPEVEKVFDVVEQMPSFPGGPSALMEWLSNNVKYPVVAQENGVQGRVVVSFVVERDGSITDVKVVRGVDPSLDREASRVVRAMPRWIPGKQNGSAVRVKYNVPVAFRLQ
ncbi:MAG: TonB family protein [Prevotella sp.]|nr:TonB family protein [Prevotella sp.]MDD7709591.1 TonB family protein [Prevotella sp.]MDY4151432.1 TonB family protein [Prevotella sp.]